MREFCYLDYKDVIKATKKPNTKNIDNFYKNNEFIDIFQSVFRFENKKNLVDMLNNWDENIKEDIELCEKLNRIEKQEIYEIKRLTLKEMTTIINIGKYSIMKLKLLPEIALAFSLGVYYATFIFEQTSLSLTIEEIYDILPENIQEENNYINFQKLFLISGTSKEIINLLFD